MRQLQLEDENVGIVLRAVSCGSMVGLGELEGKSRKLNILVQQWDQLVVKKGVLYRRYEDIRGVSICRLLPRQLFAKIF